VRERWGERGGGRERESRMERVPEERLTLERSQVDLLDLLRGGGQEGEARLPLRAGGGRSRRSSRCGAVGAGRTWEVERGGEESDG